MSSSSPHNDSSAAAPPAPPASAASEGRFAALYAPAIAFAAPLAAYAATAPRGLLWGDGVELAAACATLGIAHPTGYPLFTLLGRLFAFLPVGTVYFRVALLSAVCVAGAAALLYFQLRRLGDRFWSGTFDTSASRAALALAGALAFGFALSPWRLATQVEVYGLQALFFAAIPPLALAALEGPAPRRYAALALLWALAFTHHLLAITLLPLVLVAKIRLARSVDPQAPFWALTARRFRALLPAAALFLAGFAPWIYLPLRAAQRPALNWGDPSSWERFRWVVTGGEFREHRFLMARPGKPFTAATWMDFAAARAGDLARHLSGQILAPSAADPENPLWAVLVLMALAAFGVGAWRIARANRTFAAAWAAALLLYLFFLFTYNILDIQDYYLGLLTLLWPALWLGAAEALRLLAGEWRRAGEPPRARRAAWLALAIPIAAFLFHFRALDRSAEDLANRYAVRLMGALEPDAILLTAGDNDIYSAWYLREVEGERPDVLIYGSNFIFNDWYNAYFERRASGDRRRVAAERGRPTTDVAFAAALERLVIGPNLDVAPIYTTLDIPPLAARWRLEPAAILLTREEMTLALERGEYPPPPVLYRIAGRAGANAAPAPTGEAAP